MNAGMSSQDVQDIGEVAQELQAWLRRHIDEAGARGAVFGLSGGLDSAVVGALCRRVLGENCLGLIMPCHSLPEDTEDARLVAESLGIPYRVVDLSPVYDVMLGALGEEPDSPGGTGARQIDMGRANLKPRLRMTALYHFANSNNYLVVGSENRSEWEIGYFTKYGDGGSDLLPLAGLLKTDIYELAQYFGVPEKIIRRVPSAGLWHGQTDEEELGFSYDVLDRYLLTGEAPAAAAGKIEELRARSAHKRRIPPIGPGRVRGS